MANSVDSDQMLPSAASDLGIHCLHRLSVPILRIITVLPVTRMSQCISSCRMLICVVSKLLLRLSEDILS